MYDKNIVLIDRYENYKLQKTKEEDKKNKWSRSNKNLDST